MELIVRQGNLFAAKAADPFFFAHCISADFALGAGIAVQFDRRFQMRQRLRQAHPMFVKEFSKMQEHGKFGICLAEGNVLNLVTKLRYYEKPTRRSVFDALVSAREICEKSRIKTICMPKIAAGLDKRPWQETEEDIRRVWAGTDIRIFVYFL